MAVLNGNNPALTLNGTDITADFISVDLERTAPGVDITAGGGATDMERAPGLKDTKMTVTLVYDTTTIAGFIDEYAPGQAAYSVVYGPEGSTAGKPKHAQPFILTSMSQTGQNVKKDAVKIELSFEGAGVATTDYWAGGTF